MAIQDSKVIHFDTLSHRNKDNRDSEEAGYHRVFVGVRDFAVEQMAELTQQLFNVIDDELFKRSDKAENNAVQAMYFEAMRYIRFEAGNVQKGLQQQIVQNCDDFWGRRTLSWSQSAQAGQSGLDAAGFSLVEHSALEEDLAVTSMIEKGNNLFQSELFALNQRVGHLIGREDLESRDNPFGPQSLCRAFADVMRPLNLDLAVKLLVYKLFDRVILASLGKLYQFLGDHLADAGILPMLARSAKRSVVSSMHAEKFGREHHPALGGRMDDRSEENQQAYVEAFQSMQGMLDSWRMQMGFAPSFVGGLMGGPVSDTAEVLNALSVLQHPAALGGIGVTTETLKTYLEDQLKKLQPGGEAKSIARPEEDTVDMVSIIFDFILEDRNLPDQVKALIARLQIPVVKVAILEKSFFAKKNHPVRLLLNALAQAGLTLDSSEAEAVNPVFAKIEKTVGRILEEFDHNVELFGELLEDFTSFMEKEGQRNRQAEERTRQVTQSKEQLQLAKRKVAYEIAERLQGKPVPAEARSFLYNTWKDVLVLAHLRRDKQPEDWDGAIQVMDGLIWTTTAPQSARKEIIQVIPRLLKAVRVRLEALSLDPQAVTGALKELEACHVHRLSQMMGDQGQGGAILEDNRKVEIRDPELAQAIIEVRANLPDIEGLSLQDLATTAGETEPVDEEHLALAREMDVGRWIEYDDGKKRVRAKLSWKSHVTSTYVFVNRKGAKVLDVSQNALAKHLKDGSVRMLEGDNTPLMDRALNALLSTLRSGEDKAAVSAM